MASLPTKEKPKAIAAKARRTGPVYFDDEVFVNAYKFDSKDFKPQEAVKAREQPVEKPVEIKKPEPKKPEPILEEKYQGIGNYTNTQIYVKSGESYRGIWMSTCITGCGLGQVRGISAFLNTAQGVKELKACMEKLSERLRKYGNLGVGCVFASLGDNYYHMHDRLLEAGFEFVKEYRNYAHAAGSQRCYVYEIKELK